MSNLPSDRLVSVIIPTLNRPQMVARAITSAINQTYKDLEILIVNDGGEDISDLIHSFHDSRLVYLQQEYPSGPSGARNAALRQAKGSYIAYLDDDDLYYPQHIATLFNALHESGIHLAYTNGYYVLNRLKNGSVIAEQKTIFSYDMELPTLLIDNHIPPVAVMHSRSCIDQVGFFDETLFRHEDWDLWIRLVKVYPFVHIPEITVEYSKYDSGEREQSLSDWMGFFLNTMQIIHYRYRDLAKEYPNVERLQLKERNALRQRAFEQLKAMSEEQLEKLNPEKIMMEIVQGSLLLTKEDIKGTHALISLLNQCFPDHPILWMLNARICRVLGDFELAKTAINRAVDLSSDPVILQELLSILDHIGDHTHAQEVRDYLKKQVRN